MARIGRVHLVVAVALVLLAYLAGAVWAATNCQVQQCTVVAYEPTHSPDDIKNKYCVLTSVQADLSGTGKGWSYAYADSLYGSDSQGGGTDNNSMVGGWWLGCDGNSDCTINVAPVSGQVSSYTDPGPPHNARFPTQCKQPGS